MEEQEMKKISFYIPTELLDICDRNLERADVRSRNQFLVKAVKFYEAYLNKEELNAIITPAFETVIDARLDLTEYRLSQIIFKLAFEMAATMKYAKYSLACQYLFSDKFKDKIKDGLELLESSANKKFAPAEKMLAFIILKGELLPKDEKRAYNLLLHSVSLGDDKAEYALAKLLLNSEVIQKNTERAIKLLISAIEENNEWAKVLLGKMLLFGIDISKDEEKGIELLQSAAEQGNEYAAVILQNRENYLKYLAAMSAMRLFGYMGNLFGKKFNTDKSKTGFRIDKKQRRQIEEKKMAQGLRS